MNSSVSGNALIYVLLAVAMLAALSFAIANSGRNSVSGLSDDRAQLYATEIIEYGNILKQAVTQVRLRGYSETEISFENHTVSGYENPNCTEDGCKIFYPDGGAINYMAPKEEWLDSSASSTTSFTNVADLSGEWYFPANICIDEVGEGGHLCYLDSNTQTEIVMFLPWLDAQVCTQINELLGVDNPSETPPSIGGSMLPSAANKHVGSFIGSAWGWVDHNGYNAACVYHNSSTASPGIGHFFYQVLIAR